MFTLTLPEPPLLRGMRGEFPSSLEEAVSVPAVGVECPGTLREAMSRTPRGREEEGSSLGSTEAGEGDPVAATAAIAADPALLTWAEDARGLAPAAWEIARPSTNILRSSWYAALGLWEPICCRCRCWLVDGAPEHMLPPATSSVPSELSSVPEGTRAPRPPSCPPSRRDGRYSFPEKKPPLMFFGGRLGELGLAPHEHKGIGKCGGERVRERWEAQARGARGKGMGGGLRRFVVDKVERFDVIKGTRYQCN